MKFIILVTLSHRKSAVVIISPAPISDRYSSFSRDAWSDIPFVGSPP